MVSDPDHGKKTEGEDYLTELLCQSDSYMREFHADALSNNPFFATGIYEHEIFLPVVIKPESRFL
mgnify:CR=1 FL=1